MLNSWLIFLKKYRISFALLLVLFSLAIASYSLTMPSPVDEALVVQSVKPSGKASTLVVILHAYKDTSRDLADVQSVLKSDPLLGNLDFLIPDMPFGTFSMENPNKVAHEVVAMIDQAWEVQKYERIILIGHSMGALFARKLYVLAAGDNPNARLESEFYEFESLSNYSYSEPRPWAQNVERVILLAGMNNGWTISHHMSIQNMIVMNLGMFAGFVLEWLHDRTPIIFSIRNGSVFITQLRLQWIEMKAQFKLGHKSVGDALTVQLLGTIDDLVPPTDNIDLVTGSDFKYIEVEHSDHENVIVMDSNKAQVEREKKIREARALKLREAIQTVKEAQSDLDPVQITDVVFVVHGIRDFGYWTEKIANRVRELGKKEGRTFEAVYSSYGYFPMLGFLRPGARDEKVQWFMNNYAVAKAKFKNARFHFVGHSHGTYLLARALEKYDSVSFSNVSFAGSVVKKNFNWKSIKDQKRIHKVMNYTATADWVVGWFPHALEILGLQDLGSAGHHGFSQELEFPSFIRNEKFVIGGHDAAIREDAWNTIAQFIVYGDYYSLPPDLKGEDHNWFVKWTSGVAPALWLIIAMVLGYGFYLLTKLKTREWRKTLYMVGYLFALWTVLTKL